MDDRTLKERVEVLKKLNAQATQGPWEAVVFGDDEKELSNRPQFGVRAVNMPTYNDGQPIFGEGRTYIVAMTDDGTTRGAQDGKGLDKMVMGIMDAQFIEEMRNSITELIHYYEELEVYEKALRQAAHDKMVNCRKYTLHKCHDPELKCSSCQEQFVDNWVSLARQEYKGK